MSLESINPATGAVLERFAPASDADLEQALATAAGAAGHWRDVPLEVRTRLIDTLGQILRREREPLARLITLEMGKLIGEARSEIDKCAWLCEYYAVNAPAFLADEPIQTDASASYVAFQPLGTVLAVMPWNFPFWQVMRCAVPAITAGNTVILKHASNVPQCALAIGRLFDQAGFPSGVFQAVLASADQVNGLIGDDRVHAVSLTGSESAGRRVAETAGRYLKKSVLELGGSDAFVVLDDADLDAAIDFAARSRCLNSGQSCIAAKRFIVVESRADAFVQGFRRRLEDLRAGDPLDEATSLAPMARADLRDDVHTQVTESLHRGAERVTGAHALEHPGYFYAPTVLDRVRPGMPAFDEEVFGPVAAVVRAADEDDALRLANASRYGLGGSVWTRDTRRGEAFAHRLVCGSAFVNGLVKSDPRLPFGGIKASGYGRELSLLGIREFVNAKTVWLG